MRSVGSLGPDEDDNYLDDDCDTDGADGADDDDDDSNDEEKNIIMEMRMRSVGSLESDHQRQLHPFRFLTTFLKLDDDDDDDASCSTLLCNISSLCGQLNCALW